MKEASDKEQSMLLFLYAKMYKKINGISPNVYSVNKENVVEDITFQAAGLAVPGL